jgi:hypothetical protein
MLAGSCVTAGGVPSDRPRTDPVSPEPYPSVPLLPRDFEAAARLIANQTDHRNAAPALRLSKLGRKWVGFLGGR